MGKIDFNGFIQNDENSAGITGKIRKIGIKTTPYIQKMPMERSDAVSAGGAGATGRKRRKRCK